MLVVSSENRFDAKSDVIRVNSADANIIKIEYFAEGRDLTHTETYCIEDGETLAARAEELIAHVVGRI
jgi:hypothetical protein